MISMSYKKHRINKIVELLKYCFALGLLGFLIIKAPDQTERLISIAGAFILGGSKVKDKLGF